ncbi:UDP-4-amino-4,6-dideoxy-N-acetyl-beta-L-altrosamine transaminase [Haematobacter genomosp. 1]|uniref:UDP-4-amino-4, 6-dideoxy-N-acetyl-beta-L-altrosamine transaminase n=2 Tax=Haematobacter genomosp. 1 TaxID=366618 RepID=A0A212A9X2_9RHOB|nr:UDP-4-amino-4,6-dideoxy-N-acetyl-beta-L-altrosamine transaminase [Haematobacter genomosp. 1]
MSGIHAKQKPAIFGSAPIRERGSFIVFGKPDIGQEEIDSVGAVISSLWIGAGPETRRFEESFANYIGASGAVAVNSATAALHLAMQVLDLEPGDEVITTAMTFCATVSAILHAGATPVLCDCDPETGNILPEQIAARITPRTRAIIVVHMYGRICDMGPIMAIADAAGLPVVEDCAHAVETTWRGAHAGTIGAISCFSFYANKTLTTGEGGMFVARDPALMERARMLSLHGLSRDAWKRFSAAGYQHYDVPEVGWKYNMNDIAAAIGRVQLAGVERRLRRREEIVAHYRAALMGLPIDLPPLPDPSSRHAYHLFAVQIRPGELSIDRDGVLNAIQAENVGVGVHYRGVHLLSGFRSAKVIGWQDLPNADRVSERTRSLPLSSAMTDEEVEAACIAVRRVLEWFSC